MLTQKTKQIGIALGFVTVFALLFVADSALAQSLDFGDAKVRELQTPLRKLGFAAIGCAGILAFVAVGLGRQEGADKVMRVVVAAIGISVIIGVVAFIQGL